MAKFSSLSAMFSPSGRAKGLPTSFTPAVTPNTVGTIGAAEYLTPGTYYWTAPAGVYAVSIVCIGGGGGGSRGDGNSYNLGGAGGGGLIYANNIGVTPGATYRVTVGAGGAGTVLSGAGNHGSDSFFISNTFLCAKGGTAFTGASTTAGGTGGSFVSSSALSVQGYAGGSGGVGFVSGPIKVGGGGGGAGGYLGVGGVGASSGAGGGAYGSATTGAYSGAGGGTNSSSSVGAGAGGGGVNPFGTGGASTATIGAPSSPNGAGTATGGGGAAGGAAGGSSTWGLTSSESGAGGAYGGGAGSAPSPGAGTTTGAGGGGAVRIIWGNASTTRAFPSTNAS